MEKAWNEIFRARFDDVWVRDLAGLRHLTALSLPDYRRGAGERLRRNGISAGAKLRLLPPPSSSARAGIHDGKLRGGISHATAGGGGPGGDYN